MNHLTAAQNICIGRESKTGGAFINDAEMNRKARELFERLGVDIDPRIQVGRLTVALGREPETSEIAAEAGESPTTVKRLLAYDPPSTLDPQTFEVPDAEVMPGADPQIVSRLLRRLTAFDRALVCHLYGLAGHPLRTHAEVAAMTKRSQSTIRRRERAALQLMRAGNAADLLVA